MRGSVCVGLLCLSVGLVACGDDGGAADEAGDSTTAAQSGSTGTTSADASTSTSTGADASSGDESSSGPLVDPYDGEPLDVPVDGAWHFVDIDGMACNGGVQSGVGVRRVEGSSKLVLYFKGGGACFNGTTCSLTSGLMATGIEAIDLNPDGVLDFTRDDNPLQDYNIIYFPYCTGDVHAGTVGESTVDGTNETWNFVGHDNVLAALDRIAPTFPEPEQLVVLGTSAGGLGALVNFPYIHAGWPQADTLLLDDSGVILPDAFLNPCLQAQLRERWGFDGLLPGGCSDCSLPDGGGLSSLFTYLPERYENVRFAMIASDKDQILRLFYGFGNDDCAQDVGVPDLGVERYTEALTALRAERLDGRFAQFIIDSETHTWSTTPAFYSTETSGVSMADWFRGVLDGDMATVAP
ncbi:MAG: pectin acetylesterase-family hydrolase [Myxococcota bacterium]